MNASVLPALLSPAPAPQAAAPGTETAPPGSFAKALGRAAGTPPARPGAEPAQQRAPERGVDAAKSPAGAGAARPAGAGETADPADPAGDGAAITRPADAAKLPAGEPPPENSGHWLASLLPPAAQPMPATEGPQGQLPGAPLVPIDTPPGPGRPGAPGREILPRTTLPGLQGLPGRPGLPGAPAVTNRLPREDLPALPRPDGRVPAPDLAPPSADGRPETTLPGGGAKARLAPPAASGPGGRTPMPELAPPIAALPQPPVAAAPPLHAEPMPLPLAPLLGPPQFASQPALHAGAGADSTSATPGEARLGTAPGQPGFAPALGATIATFVRDGLQHARLHLNPAEMGPVAVQIRLDGQAAQVLMSAAHAETRAALEQAMPTLAGALREAGLTLAGGGVFEQPRDARRDGEGATADRPRGGAAPEALRGTGAAATATPVQRRGVVDLVA